MKKSIVVFVLLLFASLSVIAQKSTPYVDYKGHIYYDKKIIGTLTSAGGLDKSGKAVTRVDGNGNIVDMNGIVMGKAPKNGSFVYYFNEKPENYTIGKPSHNGMCEVKNAKGQTVMLIHQNYKAQSACAVHCLYENKCMPFNMKNKH